MTEQGERDRLASRRRGAVVEQEAHVQILGGGERCRGGCRVVGEEFKGHGRGIVGQAEEIEVDLCEVGEAEEGEEIVVGAELHLEFKLTGRVDGGVECCDNLSG